MPTVYPYIGGVPSKARFENNSGLALSGGPIYFYSARNATPVVLDPRGEANIFLLGDGDYKVTVHDSDDVLVYTVDPVKPGDGRLRADIANTTDTALGYALMVGKRSETGAQAFMLHTKNQQEIINLQTHFGVDPANSAAVNGTRLTAALAALGSGSPSGSIVGVRKGFLPAGVYDFDTALTLSAHTALYGVPYNTILKPAAAVAVGITQATGSTLHGIVIDGVNTTDKIGLSIGDSALVPN